MRKEITKYYNDLAKDYDEVRFSNSYGEYIHRQENDIIKKYLNEKEIEFNLDLACGTGRFLTYANYGADICTEMVDQSKSKYPYKHITIEDAEALSYKSSFFNNVISFHLLMHVDLNSIVKILDEANRVLKTGGYFIFDIPSQKRRKMTTYRSTTWHGANQISVKTLKALIGSKWALVSFHGIAFFPIHRIPVFIRRKIISFDTFMCNSFLKEYSSHLTFILRKQ